MTIRDPRARGGIFSRPTKRRLRCTVPDGANNSENELKSRPAQNMRPSAQIRITRTLGSWSSFSKMLPRASAQGTDSIFSFKGLFKTTSARLPMISTRKSISKRGKGMVIGLIGGKKNGALRQPQTSRKGVQSSEALFFRAAIQFDFSILPVVLVEMPSSTFGGLSLSIPLPQQDAQAP